MTYQKTNHVRSKKKTEAITTVILQIVALLVSFFFIFPILIIINNSFKTKREIVMNPPLSLPKHFGLENYITAWKKLDFTTAFTNSLIYTAISTIIIAIICTITAWAIVRGATKVFQAFRIYFMIGILIPAQALCLPLYILWSKLGLINTRFGLIAIYICTGLSFGIFLQSNFISTVPLGIEEAARIDGCNVYQTFFNITLPLLRAPMATLVIVQTFTLWNDYMVTNLVVQSKNIRTIILAMRTLFSTSKNDYSVAMAAIIISATPIIILFVCLQKQFIKGMTIGAVKG